MKRVFERYFHLTQYDTNIRTEILAGITTFFTMAYILFVNPNILSLTGMPRTAVFVATALASAVGTLMMAFVANIPYAQAPGMGLNAFFAFTVCFAMGFSWQQALAMVFICGCVGVVLTLTGARKVLIKALPRELQSAIGGGIGLFIAYIGIKDAGLLKFTVDAGSYVQMDGGSIVANGGIIPALSHLGNPAVLVSVCGLVLMIALYVRKVRGAILIGIVTTTIASLAVIALGAPANAFFPNLPAGSGIAQVMSTVSVHPAKMLEDISSLRSTFFQLDFSGLFDGSKALLTITTLIGFVLTDIFDTLGTLIGTSKRTGLFADEAAQFESGTVQTRLDKALFSDMVATSIGALLGTSNVSTYVESASGIAEGGRTGLTALSTAICFLLALPLVGLVGVIPAIATAPALIVVGMLMMGSISDIDWSDFGTAVACFLTIAFMPFAYSITTGIAMGFIAYTLVKLITGRFRKLNPILVLFTLLFLFNFVMLAMNHLS